MADNDLLLELVDKISQAARVIAISNGSNAPTSTKSTSAIQDQSSVDQGTTPQDGSVSSEQVLVATAQLMQATTDLQLLVSGPENFLKNLSLSYHDMTALAVVIEYNLAPQVPLKSSISFEALSKRSGAPLGRLERVLRLLFVRKIFRESSPGQIAHTPVSERLVTNPELAAYLGHCTHEAFPAASRLVDSMRRFPSSEGPSETGFNLALNTADPMFTWMSKNPERFDRFNLGMAGFSKHGGRSVQAVVDIYPWHRLDKAVVADVGGGHGHVSIALAKQFSGLSFVVQDLQIAVDGGAKALPDDFTDRVTYQAHDMFDEQTRQDVDIFFLRHILHDWPDDHAIKILRALLPALKSGSKVLVMDLVIPPPQLLHGPHEKFVRYLDMQMMVLHNARERTVDDFRRLFAQADPRFKVEQIWTKGSDALADTLVEVIFT